jgi:hypothetical protein
MSNFRTDVLFGTVGKDTSKFKCLGGFVASSEDLAALGVIAPAIGERVVYNRDGVRFAGRVEDKHVIFSHESPRGGSYEVAITIMVWLVLEAMPDSPH